MSSSSVAGGPTAAHANPRQPRKRNNVAGLFPTSQPLSAAAIFLTDVDQSFNIRLPALLSSINYRRHIGTAYFLRRNPQFAAPPNRAAISMGFPRREIGVTFR